MQHAASRNPISEPRGTDAAEGFGSAAMPGQLGALAQLARIVDSRSGAMLIGVGIVLALWQFIAGPEIKAAREVDRSAMREVTRSLERSAELLNSAASRIGYRP